MFCNLLSSLCYSGMEEAKSGGKALKDAGYQFDAAHTSVLQRAQTTLKTVLEEIGKFFGTSSVW